MRRRRLGVGVKFKRRADARFRCLDANGVIGREKILFRAARPDKYDSGAAFVDPSHDVGVFFRRKCAKRGRLGADNL